MKSELRILLLEDSALDARLIEQELKNAGFSFQLAMIQTEAELRRELDSQPPDLILSDHGLPAFDGFTALKIVREHHPDLPFIFVSGSNHQGMVVEMYDCGATDYVYKNDMGDLRDVVRHALNPPSEEISPPVPPAANPPQSELELQLPAASLAQPIFGLPLGQLSFCPKCMQASDEFGRPAEMKNYLGNHAEVIVLRQLCVACGRPRA